MNFFSFWHCLAGQLWSKTCASYSSRKFSIVLTTGLPALLPRPHSAVAETVSAPTPSADQYHPAVLCLLQCVPKFPASAWCLPRQGTHLPQDSFCVKLIKNLAAASTIQLFSSITTIPPEPIMAFTFFKESKSRGRSKCFVVKHPPDGPPICTAFSCSPATDTAANIVNDLAQRRAHRRLDEPGVFDIACESDCLCAGELRSAHSIFKNSSAPFKMMGGALANVSTSFRTVRLPDNGPVLLCEVALRAACRAYLDRGRQGRAPLRRQTPLRHG